MYGWIGKILRINLTNKWVSKENLKREFARKYLGGNGFAARILLDEMDKGIDPLSPENKLIVATGPATGTLYPLSGKSGVFAKSPLTNAFGEAYFGSTFGPELKYAGYDVVIVEGKAESPVYVWIHNEGVDIRDAKELWGKGIYETTELVKKDVGYYDASVISIGPAGEKLVKLACVGDSHRQAGRTGLGAVMGSKNLKAIAVRGTGGIEIANFEEFTKKREEAAERVRKAPVWESYYEYGTAGFINATQGWFPAKNYQMAAFKEHEKLDSHSWIQKYAVKHLGCPFCVMPCSRAVYIRTGPYAGTVVDNLEFENVFALGSACCISDIESIIKANELCDDYGLDVISTGSTIAWAMECYEKGIISKADTEGIELKFGNPEALIECVEKIAYREGIGAILAEGVKRASEKIGKGSDAFAMHVKGLEAPAYEGRVLKGMGLSMAVSTRGACHLRSCEYAAEEFGYPFRPLGYTQVVDKLDIEGKGKMVAAFENFTTIADCLVVCKFQRFAHTTDQYAEPLSALTGESFNGEELMKIGERVYNLERIFNIREGFTRKDDILPKRWTEEPVPYPPEFKGERLPLEDLNKMLDEYYQSRGWDKNGIPTPKKLKELDLVDLEKAIRSARAKGKKLAKS